MPIGPRSTRFSSKFRIDGGLAIDEPLGTRTSGDLPEPVRLTIDEKFPKGTITLAERLMRESAVTYEIRLRHRGKQLELVFDPDGKEVHD